MKIHQPSTNRQIVATGPGLVEVISTPNEVLGPRDVRVAVSYAGICGSDLHAIGDPELHRAAPVGDPPRRRAIGHEQVGVVVEVGSEVVQWPLGARVAVLVRTQCGRCYACRRGRIMNCEDLQRPAVGGWATYMAVDERYLVEIPESLGLRDAALAEPTACALRAVDRANIEPGSNALVIGAGPMGLILIQLLLRSGITNVWVSEPDTRRRDLAARSGADVFDPTTGDVVEWVHAQTRGRGVDVAFEVVGMALTTEQAIAATSVGGTVVVVGMASPKAIARVSPYQLFERELTITGAWGIETTFTRALECLVWMDTGLIVTDVFDLESVETAVAHARNGAGKVLLSPMGEETR